MESIDWSNQHHYPPLEGSSLFMPLISNGNNIFDNIGGNVISKDPSNPIKDTAAMLLHHHHHHHHLSFDDNQPQSGPILDSPAAATLYSPGLEYLRRPEIVANSGPGSFGSLDCLLSAANSQAETTTSIEDDGISMIFSDCKSLWMDMNHKGQGQLREIDSRNLPQEHILNKPTYGHDDNPIDSDKRKRSSSSEDLQINTHIVPSKDNSSNHKKPKKPRFSDKAQVKAAASSSNINFQQRPSSSASSGDHHHEPDTEAIAQMKEMIYRAAAFRPVDFGLEAAEKPRRRKNVKISNYPQTVAARQRRERISERIRVLQRLVPGGNKMDTASMLDEAANYLKFLRSWVKALESFGHEIGHNNSMMNSFSAAAMNLNSNNIGFSTVPFVNGALAMMHHPQQPQFSVLNHSSVHPSRS